MINFMYMVGNVIAQSFTQRVGRWQGKVAKLSDLRTKYPGVADGTSEMKALLVLFRLKKGIARMLIHAPMNYVAVYIQKGDIRGSLYGNWECISYHDSCWRTDGIDNFLYRHGEDISFCSFPMTQGFDIIETITDSIRVVKLDEVQLDGLTQIRQKRYG